LIDAHQRPRQTGRLPFRRCRRCWARLSGDARQREGQGRPPRRSRRSSTS